MIEKLRTNQTIFYIILKGICCSGNLKQSEQQLEQLFDKDVLNMDLIQQLFNKKKIENCKQMNEKNYWNCHNCTFKNNINSVKCLMCASANNFDEKLKILQENINTNNKQNINNNNFNNNSNNNSNNIQSKNSQNCKMESVSIECNKNKRLPTMELDISPSISNINVQRISTQTLNSSHQSIMNNNDPIVLTSDSNDDDDDEKQDKPTQIIVDNSKKSEKWRPGWKCVCGNTNSAKFTDCKICTRQRPQSLLDTVNICDDESYNDTINQLKDKGKRYKQYQTDIKIKTINNNAQ